jgi:hypothetical protein
MSTTYLRHKMWGLIPFLLLWVMVLVDGCGREESAFRATLSPGTELFPPLELVRLADEELLALVAHAPGRELGFYRSEDGGRSWQQWFQPPIPLEEAEDVDLAQAGTHLALAVRHGPQVWVGTLPLYSPDGSEWQSLEFVSDLPIQSMAVVCVAPEKTLAPQIHLAIISGAEGDSVRTLWQRRSPDAGSTWLGPELITAGVLSGVTLATLPDGSRSADMCYWRDNLLHWRGLSGADRTEEFRLRLQVSPDSRNRLARLDRNVLACGESARHQVVCAFSDNVGRNWSSAIALATEADCRRDPDIDAGYGLYWNVYIAGDSLLVARTSHAPTLPTDWSPGIWAHRGPTVGLPYIVALPDSSAGILHAAPEGKVYFTRVWKP